MNYARMIIALLKRVAQGENIKEEASLLYMDIAKEIDRRTVYNQPLGNLEELYNDSLWLKIQPI